MNKELRRIFNESTAETEEVATEYLEAAYGIEETEDEDCSSGNHIFNKNAVCIKCGKTAPELLDNQEEIEEDAEDYDEGIADDVIDEVESINGPTFSVRGNAGDYMGARNLLKGVSAEEVLDEVEELLKDEDYSTITIQRD